MNMHIKEKKKQVASWLIDGLQIAVGSVRMYSKFSTISEMRMWIKHEWFEMVVLF